VVNTNPIITGKHDPTMSGKHRPAIDNYTLYFEVLAMITGLFHHYTTGLAVNQSRFIYP
jgi:hypothetical protein